MKKLLMGALYSGIFTALTSGAAVFFSDGMLDKHEVILVIGMFLTGVGLYMKQHPWDGVDRRGDENVPTQTP